MAGPSQDRVTLPEIREHEAEGETAAIFADIRATQRSNNVNYIWRHLATIPGALEPAWLQVKPRQNDVRAFGEKIWVRAVALAEAAGAGRFALPAQPAGVDAVLASYARGNRWNLAAVTQLLGGDLPRAPTITPEISDTSPSIPRLPVFEELQTQVQTTIMRLSDAGPAADSGIRPSLWVHLGLWGKALTALERDLLSILKSSAFRAAHSELLRFCESSQSDRIDLPEAAIASLNRFKCRISEMTLIGAALKHDGTPISPISLHRSST